MTDGQKFGFYLPVWRRVLSAREWYRGQRSEVRGQKVETLREVLARQEEEFRSWPDPAGPVALQVLTVAKQTAAARGDARPTVTAEDLRHACTFVATAQLAAGANASQRARQQVTSSSKHLNNTQVNHLVALLKLLIDPDDLDAVTNWLHPEMAARNGLVDYIAKLAPEGLLRTIFRNLTDGESSEWRDGNKQQLVWLLKQVKSRSKEYRRPVEQKITEETKRNLELEPF